MACACVPGACAVVDAALPPLLASGFGLWTGVGGLGEGVERGLGVNPHVVTRLVCVDVSSAGVVYM